MHSLTRDFIKTSIADSQIIYKRGENIFRLGSYYLKEADYERKLFAYFVDGNYGDYDVKVEFDNGHPIYSCTCPYPDDGCKHTVAVCLDIVERITRRKTTAEIDKSKDIIPKDGYLTFDEIREQAVEDRKKSAKSEEFQITPGETYKGEHLVTNVRGKEYIVTLHDPADGKGHCTCPDFNSNRLDTCKHLIHTHFHVKEKRGFLSRIKKEKFPFVHIYWDSSKEKPRYFFDQRLPEEISDTFQDFFDEDGLYKKDDIADLDRLLERVRDIKGVRVDGYILRKLDNLLFQREVEGIRQTYIPDYSVVNIDLYPYQKKGIDFALFKKSAIIADEMGLGKTLQAIALSLLKRELFNLEKVLVITPASLKEQWKREIQRFTKEKVTVIAGSKSDRQQIYRENKDYFKITNYEAVLRDTLAINRFNPDLVILDEAQRIKNFETKTHQAIKSIPHKQSIVITGTPLENKLEDLYSIVQFADHEMLTPLWVFAADHFMLRKDKKNKIFGYKNLDSLHQKLGPLVIRRRKEEVLDSLPEQITNNYYLDLTKEQLEIHQGYLRVLLPILNKKFHTPIDIRRIQQLLASMRMVCDSTYLIDRKTNLSPKLQEVERIFSDLVIENKRKVVIFSEWTTMTFLIGRVLSNLGIPFVEFTGKVPVAKRQNLINEFNNNPECMVFLSTDAGGLGLNLQRADCVINFELPWNPAKLKQRIGRVIRIGQKSKSVNVINLIAKHSIEEKVFAGINLKQELFSGVFDGTTDQVEFSQEKKNEFINKIREMLNEEPLIPTRESAVQEELPESTPHFLNPKALEERQLDISGEEEPVETADIIDDVTDTGEKGKEVPEPGVSRQPSAEKMEEVLEKGMKFLSGLMEMSTGKPMIAEEESKTISIDRKTGEVTLKFRLPGF